MKVEANYNGMIQRAASKNPAKGVAGNNSGARAINFVENRSIINHGDSRRLFVPRSNIDGGSFTSSASRPRAILRMVSGSC
jgi:hypothetical protein